MLNELLKIMYCYEHLRFNWNIFIWLMEFMNLKNIKTLFYIHIMFECQTPLTVQSLWAPLWLFVILERNSDCNTDA